jgi:hypothetical protein
MSDRLTEKEAQFTHREEAAAIFRASMEEFARLAADASQIAADRDRYHDLARRLARVADAANEWRMWNDVSDELHEALDALNSDDLAALLGDDGA